MHCNIGVPKGLENRNKKIDSWAAKKRTKKLVCSDCEENLE